MDDNLTNTTPRQPVLLVDEETRWLRRPRDLVSAVITLLAIVGVMVVTVYGSSTALAVIRDVRTATSGIITSILFMPVNALEGLIGFFLPADAGGIGGAAPYAAVPISRDA